jgi:hypothetical protein
MSFNDGEKRKKFFWIDVWVRTHSISVVSIRYVSFLVLKSWRPKSIYVGFVAYKMAMREELSY